MKTTDLNFKVLTPTPERAQKLLAALTRAGVSYSTHLKPETAQAMCLSSGHFSFWRFPDVAGFDNDPLPELTFTEVLELLAKVETPTPTFDIKLRDEVLVRDDKCVWGIAQFARIQNHIHGHTVFGGGGFQQMVKYAGNEHLHGQTTTPDGWWEVENGNPVWRRK